MNHKNINILERIYKDRFSDIYHLVPFYNGERQNVIPVYECSYYFQGYISQGFKAYYKTEYNHYFFVADDLLLNPAINENNYSEYLRLNSDTCFIPGFISLHETKEWWNRVNESFRWRIKVDGVEAENQLPHYEKAIKKFQLFNLTLKPLNYYQIWKKPRSLIEFIKILYRDKWYVLRYIRDRFTKTQYILPYPIVGSYSDIFVISSNTIKQFCHYCGVFATTKLHVEVAIPTSMVLSANDITEENVLKLQGKALWSKMQLSELEKYNASLKQLLTNFPKTYLYLHPVKLSKWALYNFEWVT